MKVAQIQFPYGPYVGQTLDEIASTDEGLLYLDRMVDKLSPDLHLRKAIKQYLSDPTIRKELDDLLGE